jgi:hypothetical protein
MKTILIIWLLFGVIAFIIGCVHFGYRKDDRWYHIPFIILLGLISLVLMVDSIRNDWYFDKYCKK